MNWPGALDAALMASTMVATMMLLFSSENAAVLGWGGVLCITPWVARVMASFATGQPTFPVRFSCLGDTAWWRVTDIGIMALWCVLVALTCVAFVLAVAVLASDGSGDIGLDLRTLAPFGIVTAAILRIGVPLMLVGVRSSRAVMALSRGR